jgi:hypothetical protein
MVALKLGFKPINDCETEFELKQTDEKQTDEKFINMTYIEDEIINIIG